MTLHQASESTFWQIPWTAWQKSTKHSLLKRSQQIWTPTAFEGLLKCCLYIEKTKEIKVDRLLFLVFSVSAQDS